MRQSVNCYIISAFIHLDEAICLWLSRSGLPWPGRGRRLLGWCCRRGWWQGFGWRFGQDFPEKSGGHGGGEDGAISSLFDFEAVEECLYIGIGAVAADAAFGGMKEAEKGGGLFGDGVGVIRAIGEGLGAQVESAKIAGGNHGDGGLGKKQTPTAQSAKGSRLGLNAQNRKSEACQWNFAVELAQQPGPAKGRGQFEGAVK